MSEISNLVASISAAVAATPASLRKRKYAYSKGMLCPNPTCESRMSCRLDTRPSKNQTSIQRRRECQICGTRYTTEEKIREMAEVIYVIKRNGREEIFELDKLKNSLRRACVGRDWITEDRIVRIAQFIYWSIDAKTSVTKKVKVLSSRLGQECMNSLRVLDPEVAYIRYCSIHLKFKSAADWILMLDSIKKPANSP